jgi:hypothetical protein
MKKFTKLGIITGLLALCSALALAQQGASSSFPVGVILAPPTVSNAISASTASATAMTQSATGGSVAAGSYRVCVTYYTLTNTETPCSVDTAATSVIVTTGATSVVTILPPVVPPTGPNVVGWRMYVGATGGATGAETLQTITAGVCTLSASSTASCALNSPAVFTASTNFSSGSGGPATPGTALYFPIANQANQALFENSADQYHVVNWTVSGTAPSACTFNIQTGATIAALASVGQTITCTSSGSYALPSIATANYSAINLATFTAADTTTKVTFNEAALPYNPLGSIYFGPAPPSTACGAGISGLFVDQAVPSLIYTCVTTTWTAVTLP